MTTSSNHRPGRWLVALGIGSAVLGIGAYVVQVMADYLKLPRYLPVTGLLGVVCVALSLWLRRSVFRVVVLVLLLLLTGAEVGFLVMMRLPTYTGSAVIADKPFPAFATVRADGTPFTRSNLVGDQDTVMVFFRGRW